MTRFIKDRGSTVKGLHSKGFRLPAGTTAQRPSTNVAGVIRFNTSTTALEIYNGSAFVTLAKTGYASITQDSFTGDGSTVAYTMSTSVQSNEEQRVVVAIGNVYQNPATAYTVVGTTITFTSAPGNAETITVIHGFDSTTAA